MSSTCKGQHQSYQKRQSNEYEWTVVKGHEGCGFRIFYLKVSEIIAQIKREGAQIIPISQQIFGSK